MGKIMIVFGHNYPIFKQTHSHQTYHHYTIPKPSRYVSDKVTRVILAHDFGVGCLSDT